MRHLCLSLLLLFIAYGQQPETAPETKITVEVRRVPVDVIVTDAQGRFVPDLKKEDFEILEKKQSQPITSFQVEHTTSAPQSAILPPPGFFTNSSSVGTASSDLTVILFDQINTSFQDAAYARYRMEKLLTSPSLKGHPTALLVLGRGLLKLHDFSDDPATLLEAFKQRLAFVSLLPETESAETGGGNATATKPKSGHRQSFVRLNAEDRVHITLSSLTAIARSLRYRPGRKKIIWFSSGFPAIFADSPSQRNGYFGVPDPLVRRAIEDTSLAMTDARVSVYPVDVRGLGGARYFTLGPAALGGRAIQIDNREAMEMIAEQTGGIFYRGRNYFEEAVPAVVNDGTEYYALTYRPTAEKADGGFRRIEVKVHRPGLRVRYRSGYFAPTTKAESRPPSLFFDAAIEPLQRSEVQFAVSGTRISDHTARFMVVLDSSSLGLAGASGTKSMDLLLVEEPGENQMLLGEPQQLELQRPAARETDGSERRWSFTVTLPTKTQSDRVRLLLRDAVSGQIGSVDLLLEKPVS
jgi:VWFA-related protein